MNRENQLNGRRTLRMNATSKYQKRNERSISNERIPRESEKQPEGAEKIFHSEFPAD